MEKARHESYFTWEVFLMGGASIATWAATWLFFEDTGSLLPISTAAFVIAFIANHPHFAASYTLLYSDFGKRIFKRPGYFWAGVVVPVLLFAAFAAAWSLKKPSIMGHIITAMYFFVGWHYAKQVFGCVIVTSARRRYFYSALERKVLLASLFAIWFASWSYNHTLGNDFEYYGIRHMSFHLKAWVNTASMTLVVVSILAVVVMQIRKYVLDGRLPSPPGVAAYLGLVVWFVPGVPPTAFSYLVPFFHSLQYLVFVWVLKTNETKFEIQKLKDQQWRAAWLLKFGGYMLTVGILGALFFEFIPRALDATKYTPGDGFGAEPFMASFLLFINVHHYFIDNIIWKSNNETVKKFLFQPAEAIVQVAEPTQERPAS